MKRNFSRTDCGRRVEGAPVHLPFTQVVPSPPIHLDSLAWLDLWCAPGSGGAEGSVAAMTAWLRDLWLLRPAMG